MTKPEPRTVDPVVLALDVMAAKVARIRDEIDDWRTDDSEHSTAWSLAADLIEHILDADPLHPFGAKHQN